MGLFDAIRRRLMLPLLDLARRERRSDELRADAEQAITEAKATRAMVQESRHARSLLHLPTPAEWDAAYRERFGGG